MRYKQGLILIPLLILMVFASIMILGMSFFVANHSKKNLFSESLLQSGYIAEAGIQEALYLFRDYGDFPLGTVIVNTNQEYTLMIEEDADVLLIDPQNTSLTTKKKEIELGGLNIRTATDPDTILLTDMVVTWNTSLRLQDISIGGPSVWKGNATSPAYCNISDMIIDERNQAIVLSYNLGDTSGMVISIEFVLSDGSSKTVQVYPASSTGLDFEFQSQGSVTNAAATLSTTIETHYDSITEQILGYRKVQ